VVQDSNLRHYEHKGEAAFCKPGFEERLPGVKPKPKDPGPHDYAWRFGLETHQMSSLCPGLSKGPVPIDAQPRIEPKVSLKPEHNLLDLELARMQDAMLVRTQNKTFFTAPKRDCTLQWHEPQPDTPRSLWLIGLLPQFQRFRQDDQKRDDVALLPDEEEETLLLHRVQDGERRYEKLYVPIHQSLCHPVPAAQLASPSVSPWPQVGLMEELAALAQAQGLSLEHCAERYATASLPESQAGWRWNERLGFSKKA
jgi:CRISPR-associated endonuclease/helicase Cas3